MSLCEWVEQTCAARRGQTATHNRGRMSTAGRTGRRGGHTHWVRRRAASRASHGVQVRSHRTSECPSCKRGEGDGSASCSAHVPARKRILGRSGGGRTHWLGRVRWRSRARCRDLRGTAWISSGSRRAAGRGGGGGEARYREAVGDRLWRHRRAGCPTRIFIPRC